MKLGLFVDSIIETPVRAKGTDFFVSSKFRKNDGKYIVFLHGLQSTKNLFFEAFEREFFKEKSLLAIDFVGFGDSSKPDDFSYDIEDQAQAIADVLERLEIEQFHLVGHSLGGMVGTVLLHRIPTKISSFSNLEGNFCFEDCGASHDIASNPMPKTMAKAYYLTACSIVSWSKNEKLKEYWNKSHHKKKLLVGDKSAYASKIMATAQIPNAGHFMLRDNPAETYACIERFISSCT